MKRSSRKNFDFVVVRTCQGQPLYYRCKNLMHALFTYARIYLKYRRHGTMNFTLKQRFNGPSLSQK